MNHSAWRGLSVILLVGLIAAMNGQTLAHPHGPEGFEPLAVESRTSPPTLKRAFDAAWERAVIAREAAGAAQRAGASGVAAASLLAAAPSFEYSQRSDRWHDDIGRKESEVGISLPLWLPGQRSAQRIAASAEADWAASNLEVARLRVASDVREAAWDLVRLQAEADLAEQQAALLEKLFADVARRVAAGDLARADSLAAEAEALDVRALQRAAGQRLRQAEARWTLLTGLPPVVDATEAERKPAATSHPEANATSKQLDWSRARLDAARRSPRDAPELALQWRDDVPGLGGAAQRSIALALRIPFSTAQRNQPLLAAAQADADVAQAQAAQTADRLRLDIATAESGLIAAQAQADSAARRAELLRERARLLQAAFDAGEAALPDLLRAHAAAGEAANHQSRQRAALGLARARLNHAHGLLP